MLGKLNSTNDWYVIFTPNHRANEETTEPSFFGITRNIRGSQPPRVFPVTPQKPRVSHPVAHLHPLIAMVICELVNQFREQFISQHQFSVLLHWVQSSYLTPNLRTSCTQDKMWHSQEEAATRALKQAKHKKPYSFKRKGNEEPEVFMFALIRHLWRCRWTCLDPVNHQRSNKAFAQW